MANVLDNIFPKILARGLRSLRQKVIMPRLVNTDYDTEARMKGDVINIPVPVAQTASDVTPSNVYPVPASNTPGNVQIQMDNWKHSDFHLNDKEILQIERDRHFFPMQAEEAIKALARVVNQDIFSNYLGVFGYTGTAGQTPFGNAGAPPISTTMPAEGPAIRKILNEQLCPKDQRRVVLDFAAEAYALTLNAFRDVSQSGKDSVVIEGELGRFFGMEWYSDDDVPTHTAGTGSGYLVNNVGGYPAGTTSIAVDLGTGTLVVGDIITFAGVSGTYVVTTGIAAPGTVVIYPGLAGSVADDAAVSLKATHVVNLAFNRFGLAFATRPLISSVVDLELGNRIMSMPDPVSGITLRLELMRQYKQTVWDFDILWGSKLVRPELAARLAG